MKARPILFSGPMVRAILDGRKTQTRRIVRPQPQMVTDHSIEPWQGDSAALLRLLTESKHGCPYGKPGDVLWCRETWSDVNLQGAPGIAYRADDDIRDLMAEPTFHDEDGAFNYEDERVKRYGFAVWSEDLIAGTEGQWRPSIHMPRWGSRITLEIESIRVGRLQGISEADAIAEGIERIELDTPGWHQYRNYLDDNPSVQFGFPQNSFRSLWESINGPESWSGNPWVWVVEFKPHLMNVDEFLKQREAA